MSFLYELKPFYTIYFNFVNKILFKNAVLLQMNHFIQHNLK
jgi:hypothetical protein